MHDTIREWIVEVLECHQHLLAIALRQRAKFEGWLKFELAMVAEKHGAQSVEVETASNGGTPRVNALICRSLSMVAATTSSLKQQAQVTGCQDSVTRLVLLQRT